VSETLQAGPLTLTEIAFPRYGRRASRANTILYRVLGSVSRYYDGRAALQECSLPIAQAVRRSVITSDGKLFFLKNPKAACSTVLQLIHEHEHGRPGEVRQLHRSREIQQGIPFARTLIRAIDDPKCVRFTAVRDPASRAVSAFMMFFGGAGAEVFKSQAQAQKWAKREAGMWALGYDPKGSIERNFDVFLEYVSRCLATDREHVNVHWKPQTLCIAHGHIRYAHICRVETLQHDLRTVGDLVGFPLSRPGDDIPTVNRARRRSGFELTPSQRRKIRDLYAEDYEAFGY
jgi:hypothetical protein